MIESSFFRPLLPVLAACLTVGLQSQASAGAQDQLAPGSRTMVRSAADMPALSFTLKERPGKAVRDAVTLRALAEAVYRDTDQVLQTHDFADPAGLNILREAKANAAMVLGRSAEALALQEAIAETSPKPEERLTAGLTTRAIIAAQAAGPDLAMRQAAFRATLDRELSKLPRSMVEARLRARKAGFETLNPKAIVASIEAPLDPIYARSRSINLEMADALLSTGFSLGLLEDYRHEVLAALDAFLAAPAAAATENIWLERAVSIPAEGLTPVRVAVWDTGFDPALFPGQLHINAADPVNGVDDDGNGYVDDHHGIAFDRQSRRSSAPLRPLSHDQLARQAELTRLFQGSADLASGIASTEASFYRKTRENLQPVETAPFLESMELYADYVHGTHVAGIVAAGNPAVRLLHVRMEPHVGLLPEVPDEERMAAFARSFAESVAYIRKADVRIANLSWGLSRAGIEQAFLAHNLEPDPAARRTRVDHLFAMAETAMREAIASAPEILFVVAAGNNDIDLGFAQAVPAGLDLPNVLTVGAVDAAGRQTGFTSTGQDVDLHANGYQIESVVPGGARVRFSGTSMAAPQVANLAAKLLALHPRLTTAQLADLIRRGADPQREDGVITFHPRRTLDLASAGN
jgi:subtilisin family serine protease